MRFCLFAVALLMSLPVAAGPSVRVLALFPDKAMVEIDGQRRILASGKRDASGIRLISANPNEAVVEIDGRRETLVLGSPGGSRIPTATAQVLLNLIVDGDELQAAVDRPRIHHQWKPDEIFAERYALAPETRRALEERGHRVRMTERLGEVSAVRLGADGVMQAAQDPRGPGGAGVVRPASD